MILQLNSVSKRVKVNHIDMLDYKMVMNVEETPVLVTMVEHQTKIVICLVHMTILNCVEVATET